MNPKGSRERVRRARRASGTLSMATGEAKGPTLHQRRWPTGPSNQKPATYCLLGGTSRHTRAAVEGNRDPPPGLKRPKRPSAPRSQTCPAPPNSSWREKKNAVTCSAALHLHKCFRQRSKIRMGGRGKLCVEQHVNHLKSRRILTL